MDDLIKVIYFSRLFYKVNFKKAFGSDISNGVSTIKVGKSNIKSAIDLLVLPQWIKGHSAGQERKDIIRRIEAFIEEHLG